MVIRERNALGRQNDKKIRAETKPQTIEQRLLQIFNGLLGGCHKVDCICQAFPERNSFALSEQTAEVFNRLILSGKIRLSQIRLNHGKATVYFTVINRKTGILKH